MLVADVSLIPALTGGVVTPSEWWGLAVVWGLARVWGLTEGLTGVWGLTESGD